MTKSEVIENYKQAKAKLEMAKSKLQAGSGNVFINAQDGADVGINLKELWKDE